MKRFADRQMLVLALLGLFGASPAIAVPPSPTPPPPPKPLAQRANAALCDSPVPMLPQISVDAPTLGGLFNTIRGASATAADLFARSQYESKPADKIAALNRAIALAPNYQKAYRERARLYKLGQHKLDQQQLDLVLADYDRAFQLQPDDFNLLAGQGLVYGDLQQWEKLIAVYDRLYPVRPNLAAHYHTIQARAYAELQRWPEVIQQYTIAIQLDQLKGVPALIKDDELADTPGFSTQLRGTMALWNDPSGQALLYLNRGYAHERQNQTQLANADYELAFASVKQLPLSVEQLYRSRCRLKVWAGEMAGAKLDAKLANETWEAWQRSQLPPQPLPTTFLDSPLPLPSVVLPSLPPQPMSQPISPSMGDGRPATEAELREMNRRLVMEKNVELGIPAEYFDPAMPMDRDFAPAYYHRGILRLQTEQFESGLVDFDRAIVLNPQFSLAQAARGETLRQLKRSEEAMMALEQALQLDPTLAAARLSQGMIWLERGDLQQAELAFEEVLAIDPESIGALTERAEIRRSRRDIIGSTADERRIKFVQERWQLPSQLPSPKL
jgi:tetratricopeptide (TPR) repeat protein